MPAISKILIAAFLVTLYGCTDPAETTTEPATVVEAATDVSEETEVIGHEAGTEALVSREGAAIDGQLQIVATDIDCAERLLGIVGLAGDLHLEDFDS